MGLRVLHTSDWHLGKKLFKVDRLPEQIFFLNWLLETLIQEDIHVLLVAGDIFDTPHPPTDALKAYFDFLVKVKEKTLCQVFIVGGNHDSGKFLEAPAGILKSHRIHCCGQLKANWREHFHFVKFPDEPNCELMISLLPYFRSHELYNWQDGTHSKQQDHPEETYLNRLKQFFDYVPTLIEERQTAWPGVKLAGRILVSHHLFGQFELAGSEQALYLSGLESIPPGLLEGKFDYVALGHIHRSQVIRQSSPHIYYPGSPVPMRFSEIGQKQVAIVEFSGHLEQSFQKTVVPIPVFRELVSLKGHCEDQSFMDSMAQQIPSPPKQTGLTTLLEVTLEGSGPVAGLADQLKEKLKEIDVQLLGFYFDTRTSPNSEESPKVALSCLTELSIEELFRSYYQQKFPEDRDSQRTKEHQVFEDFKLLLEEVRMIGVSKIEGSPPTSTVETFS